MGPLGNIPPADLGVEILYFFIIGAGCRRNGLNARLPIDIHLDPVKTQRGIEVCRFEAESVLFRVGQNTFDGKRLENVALCFGRDVQSIVILDLLCLHGRLQPPLPHVVPGRSQCPGPGFRVQFFKKTDGRHGGSKDASTLVNTSVDGQAVLSAGGFQKLPETDRPFDGTGVGPQCTFHHGDIFEIFGQAVFFQKFFDDGKIASGTLDLQNHLSPVPKG